MNVALVGLGYWGPKLLRNLVDLVGVDRVVAVDNDLTRLDLTCRQYPGLRASLNLDQALEDHDLDAVVIATPLETHARLATTALKAGKHVLVEKPLASSPREAFDLVDLAVSGNLTLMVGHTFLFSPRVEAMAQYMATGKLGAVHYVTSSRLNLGLHRTDANVIWDLAPHDFSILFHILGEFPIAVQTSARSIVRPSIPEVAFMSLEFPSGVIASVDVSWLAPRKVRNTVVVGESQMIVYEDTNSEEPIKIYDKGVVVPESSSFGENQLTYRYGDTIAPHVAATEPLGLQVSHFLDAAAHGTRVLSDGWFGLRVVEALEAAHRSWECGGIPVEVGAEVDLAR